MSNLIDIPEAVTVRALQEGVDFDTYPEWLLRMAQAWWAVLPPTHCQVRWNGEEAILDTLFQRPEERCSLRLDLVECRVRYNQIELTWIEDQGVEPKPTTPFYASADTTGPIRINDLAVITAVAGVLAYPSHVLASDPSNSFVRRG